MKNMNRSIFTFGLLLISYHHYASDNKIVYIIPAHLMEDHGDEEQEQERIEREYRKKSLPPMIEADRAVDSKRTSDDEEREDAKNHIKDLQYVIATNKLDASRKKQELIYANVGTGMYRNKNEKNKDICHRRALIEDISGPSEDPYDLTASSIETMFNELNDASKVEKFQVQPDEWARFDEVIRDKFGDREPRAIEVQIGPKQWRDSTLDFIMKHEKHRFPKNVRVFF